MKLKKYTLASLCSLFLLPLVSCSSVGENYRVGHLFVPMGSSSTEDSFEKAIVTPFKIASGDFSSTSKTTFRAGKGKELVPVGMDYDDYDTLYKAATITKLGKEIREYNALEKKLIAEKNKPVANQNRPNINKWEKRISDLDDLIADRTLNRNELARKLILISDTMVEEYLANTMGVSASMNVGSATITNLTSTAATIFNPSSTKNILSGFAGFSNASRSLWNEEIYRNAFIEAVVGKMRDNRNDAWITIKENFKKSAFEYPVDQMLLDVNRYHYSGSFAEALKDVVANATREKSDFEIENLIGFLEKEKTAEVNKGASGDQDLIKKLDTKIKGLKEKLIERLIK